MTDISAAGVYLGRDQGFAPCTAEAVTVMLDYYHIDCAESGRWSLGAPRWWDGPRPCCCWRGTPR